MATIGATGFQRRVIPREVLLVAIGVVASIGLAVAAVAVAISSDDAPTGSETAAAPQIGAPAVIGSVTSDGRNGGPLALVAGAPIFPLPVSGSLDSWANAPVEVQDLPVQSLAPAGFWLGFDQAERVYVSVPTPIIENGALAPQSLAIGELVNVSGRMGELPQNLGSLGMDGVSRQQLSDNGQMIVANSVRRSTR